MKIAVVGDAVLDVEVSQGNFGRACPENVGIPLFKGSRLGVFAGGAGNVANIIRDQKCTVDLYCDGPGQGDREWVGSLFKRVVRANRVVWSNKSSVSLKLRGLDGHNQVVSRIDADAETNSKGPFPGLYGLLDNVDKYDAVLISDYCKGTINIETEQVIADILRTANCTVVDTKRQGDVSLWKSATAITPNHQEALSIYGTGCPFEIQQMVGCKVCYITRGKDTVLMGCADGVTEISVSEDVDEPYVVGAGDGFAAGVALALGQGKSYLEAGMMGVKIAQSYVGKVRRSPLRSATHRSKP